MTMAPPVHYEPIAASAAIGSPFFAVPPSRIAARRIRACAARARTANPPRRGLGIAAVTVLRTVDGRSPHSSETDRGDVRAASPTLQLHVAVADRCTGACIDLALSLVTMTTTMAKVRPRVQQLSPC